MVFRIPSVDENGRFPDDIENRLEGMISQPGPPGAGVPEGGAPLQVIRKTPAGNTTEWVTPTKGMVGLSNVDNTKDVDKPISTAQGNALAGKVGKGDLVINAKDYGAKGDGVTDDTDALNAANSQAATLGARLFIPSGNYRIESTVTVTVELDASLATFNYYGTGLALRIGPSSGVLMHKAFSLPSVYYRTGADWAEGTVGIELCNLNTCEVHHNGRINGFHYGYRFIGRGAGFAYNEIHLGYSDQNRIAYHLTQDEGGWCNENSFHAGRVQIVAVKGAVPDDRGAHYVLVEQASTSISGPNNNRFFGCSFEGSNFSYYRVKMIGGRYNTFYGCRWENYGSTYRIRYEQNSTGNIIHYGYDAWKLIIEADASSTGNITYDGAGARAQARAHSSQAIPTGVDTSLASWTSLTLGRATYDSATGRFTPTAGEWRMDATVAFTPNTMGRRTAYLVVAEPGGTVSRVSFDEVPAGATGAAVLKLSGRWKFTGTQQFWIVVNQNSGADLAIYGGTGNTTLYADMLLV